MIEVRIRHIDEARPVRLCDWDPADIDGVFRMLCDQGVRTESGEQYAGRDHFTGEIVIEDGAAFFEVVITDQV